MRPTVNTLSPRWGVRGTVVTITGSAFTGATRVSFGGVAASSFTVDSYTEIRATVPASAPTKKVVVKVMTKGGAGTASTRFEVLVAGPGWPQYGYDSAHTGYNPNETTLAPGNVSGLQLAWSKRRGLASVVADGILYVAWSGFKVRAFDATNGDPLWTAFTSGHP